MSTVFQEFDCISEHTHTQETTYYVYMQMLVTVVMKIVLQLVKINAFKLEPKETGIFF